MRSPIKLLGAALVLAVLGGVAAAGAQAGQPHPFRGDRTVTVMTRNLYLGTDLRPIFAAPTLPALFTAVANGYAQVQATNFPERAQAIAGEIAAAEPDLVGLQEAALYRTDFPPDGPASPAETVTYDFVQILLDALEARGQHYEVVALSTGTDAELPSGFPPTRDVRLTDREVLLARADLKTADLKLSNAQAGNYATQLVVPTVGGPLPIPRGWVSVDVKIRGKEFRVVTTHLEAFSAAAQVAQGNELVSGPGATVLPIVAIGDFNSRADGTGTPTYANLIAAGFEDAWSVVHPGVPGYTCCFVASLIDGPPLSGRVDLVLARGGFTALDAEIVGEETDDRTPSGLWPSDHAGVVAALELP